LAAAGLPLSIRRKSAAVESAASGLIGALPSRVRMSAAMETGSVAAMTAGVASSGNAASEMRTPSSSGRFAAAPSQSLFAANALWRPAPNSL